jgi:transposase-like protein
MTRLPEPVIGKVLAPFADDLSAHEFVEKVLWPGGVVCPRCGGCDRLGKLNGGTVRLGTYKCYRCRRAFSITHGTIFESSHVPLHKWLQAIYLTEGGIVPMRPRHLQGILNVSFKTASAMLRRLQEVADMSPDRPGRSEASARRATRRPPSAHTQEPGLPNRRSYSASGTP